MRVQGSSPHNLHYEYDAHGYGKQHQHPVAVSQGSIIFKHTQDDKDHGNTDHQRVREDNVGEEGAATIKRGDADGGSH